MLGLFFILLGLTLVLFGFFINGKTDNRDQISYKYSCGRLTADFRSTDIYCDTPEKAPEYKVSYSLDNKFVYSGLLITVAGMSFIFLTKRER